MPKIKGKATRTRAQELFANGASVDYVFSQLRKEGYSVKLPTLKVYHSSWKNSRPLANNNPVDSDLSGAGNNNGHSNSELETQVQEKTETQTQQETQTVTDPIIANQQLIKGAPFHFAVSSTNELPEGNTLAENYRSENVENIQPEKPLTPQEQVDLDAFAGITGDLLSLAFEIPQVKDIFEGYTPEKKDINAINDNTKKLVEKHNVAVATKYGTEINTGFSVAMPFLKGAMHAMKIKNERAEIEAKKKPKEQKPAIERITQTTEEKTEETLMREEIARANAEIQNQRE